MAEGLRLLLLERGGEGGTTSASTDTSLSLDSLLLPLESVESLESLDAAGSKCGSASVSSRSDCGSDSGSGR